MGLLHRRLGSGRDRAEEVWLRLAGLPLYCGGLW